MFAQLQGAQLAFYHHKGPQAAAVTYHTFCISQSEWAECRLNMLQHIGILRIRAEKNGTKKKIRISILKIRHFFFIIKGCFHIRNSLRKVSSKTTNIIFFLHTFELKVALLLLVLILTSYRSSSLFQQGVQILCLNIQIHNLCR